MDYYNLVYGARYSFPVITALFFIIKLFGGGSCDRKHSLILCFLCVLYFITPELDETLPKDLYRAAYVKALFIEILISGAGMLAMFIAALSDKKAFTHAMVLAFIILINFMLTYHYTISPLPPFKSWFNELIIIASILQIMVSYDGFTKSISRIIGFIGSLQRVVGWAFFSCLCWIRNIQENINSEKGS